ncbi:uncharacterized protein LOC128213890 isoform X7 [Mya arenaria]|uniref:uncharacterized protein LOC128213890 isoform X7 n=1 Tax=Mya arenaria TaxID=6604 RepID=UPI0022E042FE|nr:uncharacterized protein LOC128213890 isoform X7 [Mya arenaria]
MWNAMKYNYNVREAYRFHFDEPPAAPLTHEETRRVRQIMDWDKHQADVSPRARNKQTKMSERTGLEHYMTSDIIRKDAPFGTTDTPCITMKIIGGRQVPVIEKHATFDPEYLGSRIQPLRPIADKPNHVDPRVHGDNPGAYYNRDVQKSLIRSDLSSPRPTAGVNKRPDSKDVVRAAQYRTLPPIQQNRTRNDMSTVFEAEPWTDNRAPQLADETEYKQNYFLGGSETMDQRYENPGYKEHHLVPDSELSNLRMLVPRNVLLPVDPIRLTRDQEVVLCKLICNELPRFDSRKLRDVYLECSQLDKGLSGFCDPYTLKTSLERHNAFLPESLSIIGAQFVDPNYPGRVNYEKVLSFIGSALDLNTKGQLEKGLTPRRQEKEREYEYEEKPRESPHRSQSNERPKYYMENGETFKTGSIYRDREVAKLLQMITTELSKSNYKMDWTSWQNAFFEKDRDRRDTLSAAQIKDICYDHKLPLSDSLLNQILSLCEDSNRDGQYKWHEFLEFMRRVRPSLTGLPIPVSKRPLDYAKHYPAPGPNWPRTEDSTEHRNSSPRRDISPRREPPSHRKGQDDRVTSVLGQFDEWKLPEETKQKTVRFYEDKYKYIMDNYSPDRDRRPRSPRDSLKSPTRNERETSPYQTNMERGRPPHSPRRNEPGRHRSLSPEYQDNRYDGVQSKTELFPPLNDNEKDWRQPRTLKRFYSDRRKFTRDGNRNDYGNRDVQKDGKVDQYGGRSEDKRRDNWQQHRRMDYEDNLKQSNFAESPTDLRRRSYAESPSGYVPSWQQRTERGDYEPRDRNRDMPRRNERVASLLQRAPSRYERPKSYAEPQREIGSYNIPNQETRHRSLSPVRQASPGRQQSPYRQATPRLPSPSKEPTVASYPQAYRDNYINDGKDDGGFDREIPSYPIHNPPYMQQTQQTSLGNQQYQSYGGPQPHVEQQGVVRQDQSYSRPKYQTYQPYIPSFSNQQSQQQPQQQQQQIPQSPTFEDQNVSQYRLQYVSPVTQARQAYDLVEQNKPRYGDSRRDDPYYRGGGGDTNRSNREQQINQLSHQLRDLEAKYEVTRDGMESKEKPWLERYLKLAQALYNSDISNKGCLPRQDVIEIVEQYNNAFNLNLDMNRANMMAISPDVLDKSGNILLRPFLANLSRR